MSRQEQNHGFMDSQVHTFLRDGYNRRSRVVQANRLGRHSWPSRVREAFSASQLCHSLRRLRQCSAPWDLLGGEHGGGQADPKTEL